MSGKPLRAVVAGAGLMGHWHAATVRSLGMPVVAIVDPDAVRGKALAAAASGNRWFPDLDAALHAGGADVAHICAPLPYHVRLASRALEGGCHALVEKPLAPSEREVEALYGRARATGRLLCPVHQFLYQSGVRKALARLPDLGALRHVDLVACSAGGEGRAEADRSALVLEILPHALALLARLLPATASPEPWHTAVPFAGELRLTTCRGATSASILISLSGRPTRNTLRLIAERGTIHVDLFHGFATLERGRSSRVYKATRPFAVALSTLAWGGVNLGARTARREWAYPGLKDLIRAFYHAAERSSRPPIPESETLLAARWLDEIASLVAGRGVALAIPDP